MRASALPLAAKCRGSFTIGSEDDSGPRQNSSFGRMGTAFHEIAYARIMNGVVDFSTIATKYGLTQEEADDLRRGVEKINLSIPPGFEIHGEQQLQHPEMNLRGSPDFWAVSRETNHMIVMDWKSGWLDVEPPESNWQIIAYIMLLLVLYDFVETIEAHIVQPRYNQVKSFTFTRDLIRQLEPDIRMIIAESEVENAPITTGPWCHSCFKSMKCPAFAGAIVKISGLIFPDLVPMEEGKELADMKTILAKALPFAKSFDRISKHIQELAKAYVDIHGELDLGGGLVFGKQVDIKEEIDFATALPILREKFNNSVDSKLKITKNAIKELAQQTKKRGAYIEIMKELESHGAIKETTTQKYTFIKKGESLV